MIRSILIIVGIFFFFQIAKSQDYLRRNRDDIKKYALMDADSSSKFSFSERIIRIDSSFTKRGKIYHYSDTLISNLKIRIDGPEKSEKEYFFDTSYFGLNDCDSVAIKYYCCECAKKQIGSFMKGTFFYAKQLTPDIYISDEVISKVAYGLSLRWYFVVPKMTIKRTPGQPVCITVSFTSLELTRRKWKRLTR